jgi:hypothetical protein
VTGPERGQVDPDEPSDGSVVVAFASDEVRPVVADREEEVHHPVTFLRGRSPGQEHPSRHPPRLVPG